MQACDKRYLETIYSNLDQEKFCYFTIEKQIQNYNDPERTLLTIELKCQGFFLQSGELHPIIEFPNIKIPDIQSFTSGEIDYITQRLETERNDILIARYAHILFLRTKNRTYALRALLSYHNIANNYYEQLLAEKKNIYDFTEIIHVYLKLATSIKYKIDETKSYILDWYAKKNHHLFYYLRFLEIILDSSAFKRVDLMGFTERAVDTWQNNRNYQHDERYMEMCIRLAKKEGYDTKIIYRHLAEIKLEMAEKEKDRDESNVILSECLYEASNYYKLAGEKELSEKYLKKFEDSRSKIKFQVISHEMSRKNMETLKEVYKNIARSYVSHKSNNIFIALTFDKRLLPDLNKIEPQEPFLSSIRTSYYDLNMNVRVLSEFENKRHQKFGHYKMGLEITLVLLFEELRKQMKDNNRDLLKEGLEFFEATWLNETFQRRFSEEIIEYKWLESLKPAIEILLNATIQDDKYQLDPTEQMAFDQLAIKFEGILRDICQIAQIVTTKVNNKETIQMDINDLLQSKALEDIFEETDLHLWQYAFTRAGYNIRNDVAHSFLRPPHYTVRKANLLLLCYIKIARYGTLLSKQED